MRAAAKILPRQSQSGNDKFWLNATRDTHTATAAAFGLLAVRNADDFAQRLRCGRLWQRMHLWATTQGLALHPLNQMPERAAREQVLRLNPKFGNALMAAFSRVRPVHSELGQVQNLSQQIKESYSSTNCYKYRKSHGSRS